MSTLPALSNLASEINKAHEAAEHSFRSGVEHAIRAGELLIQAKAAVPHGAWEAWVRDNVAFSPRTARAYMQLAALDPAKRQRVAEMPLREAIRAAGNHALTVTCSSESVEWYTPAPIATAASNFLGGIDLDPSWHPDSPVTAACTFTKADDGLAQPWTGRVWLNPPYGREIGPWIERLVREHESGEVPEALTLVPARVDTEWFATLDPYPRCFVRGRVTFSNATSPAPFPSAIVYLGNRVAEFAEAFGSVGPVFVRLTEQRAAA